jgi:hypothetical protein
LSITVIACDLGVYLNERGKVTDSISEAVNLSISIAAPEISAFKLSGLPRMTDNERAKSNFLGSAISPQTVLYSSAWLVGDEIINPIRTASLITKVREEYLAALLWRSTPPRRTETNMLTTRDLIRIRYIIWKVGSVSL